VLSGSSFTRNTPDSRMDASCSDSTQWLQCETSSFVLKFNQPLRFNSNVQADLFLVVIPLETWLDWTLPNWVTWMQDWHKICEIKFNCWALILMDPLCFGNRWIPAVTAEKREGSSILPLSDFSARHVQTSWNATVNTGLVALPLQKDLDWTFCHCFHCFHSATSM